MQLLKPYVHIVQNMLLCLTIPNIHATQYYFFQNSNTNMKKFHVSDCPKHYLQSLNLNKTMKNSCTCAKNTTE